MRKRLRTRLRLLRDGLRLRRSGLFDADWYLARYPDVRASGADPAVHYLRHGVAEARDPGPRFSTSAYLAAYPDVLETGLNPLLHYLDHGRAERRRAFLVEPDRPPSALRRMLMRPRQVFAYPEASAAAGSALTAGAQTSSAQTSSAQTGSVQTDVTKTGPLVLDDRCAAPPTGWALVHVPATPDGHRLTLRVVAASGSIRETPLAHRPDAGSSSLIRLPDAVRAVTLRRDIIDGDATAPMKGAVAIQEIGRTEAMLRVAFAGGWAETLARLRRLFGALRRHGLRGALAALAARHLPVGISSYQEWIELYDRPDSEQLAGLRARAAAMTAQPRFSVLVPVYDTPARWLTEMIESVRAQLYPHWELCIADDGSTAPHVRPLLQQAAESDARIKLCLCETNGRISAATNAALGLATGEYVALLDHDDVLAPHALLLMAEAVAANPGVDLLYSDEDKLDAQGRRCDPYFKPDFSPELLGGQNFLNHLTVCRTRLLRELGGFRSAFDGSQDYDMVLRATAATRRPVVHVPHVLYHWRLYPGGQTFSATQIARATEAARAAIREQAASLGESVEVAPGLGHYHRVIYPSPAVWPRVTAIVPTRDHLDVLRVCIDGLLDATDYPALDILIADNGSVEPATLAWFEQVAARGVRVLPCPGAFNYSAINNAAARAAQGEILLLLNNDISMNGPWTDPGWLREMVTLMLRPKVGAVGAKLLYPDGSVQHAGVVLGIGGVAGHIHLGAGGDEGGYFGRLRMVQEVGCCTAACLAVWADAFAAAGGLDEANLAIAFNDVDLCLRLRAAGRRILWTPYATLTHWESRSRGSDQVPGRVERFNAEVDYMKARWGSALVSDPFFNANLSLEHMYPTLGFPPRAPRPWDATAERPDSKAVNA